MATFTFSVVDESAGLKSERRYVVDDKESARILACYDDCYRCKDDYDKAFQHMAEQMMAAVTSYVCAYERAKAADPIVPKQDD